MFLPEPSVRIWLCTDPVDMRKSFNGLSAVVSNQLGENPLSGQLFVFVNRRRTLMKVLYFESSGFCIWSKQLEQGQFHVGLSEAGKLELDWTKLKLLLCGIEVEKSRQYKRYCHRSIEEKADIRYNPKLCKSPF